ncbi:MAG TPA: SRPBCC domain-containing protein [Cyclobacteriaceae bacterium]
MEKPTGLTKDAGWQMGVRKTLPIPVADVWEFLFSEEGLPVWLGKINDLEWKKGESFRTSNGTEGMIRVFSPLSHIRITWKKKGWENSSSVQVRTLKGKNKTTIVFHQDRLTGADQREEMLKHWEKVLNKLEKNLTDKAIV